MAKVKPVNLQSLGDALDTPFISIIGKNLIRAAWKGDLKNFVKYLFRFVWFGTRDYTMALIILTFIVAASKDDTVKEHLNNNVSTGNISRLFERIGRGDGKELKNFLNGEGKWFKELFEGLLKNHLEFKNDKDENKKNDAIEGLWKKFINQVQKMKQWIVNEKYVRENLCGAIARSLGDQIVKKVEDNLSPPIRREENSRVEPVAVSTTDPENSLMSQIEKGGRTDSSTNTTRDENKNKAFVIKGFEMNDLTYRAYEYTNEQGDQKTAYLPFPREGHDKASKIVLKVVNFASTWNGKAVFKSPEPFNGNKFISQLLKYLKGLKCDRLVRAGTKSLDSFFDVVPGDPGAQLIVDCPQSEEKIDLYYNDLYNFARDEADKLLRSKEIELNDDNVFLLGEGIDPKKGVSCKLYRVVKDQETIYMFTKQGEPLSIGVIVRLFLKSDKPKEKREKVYEFIVKKTDDEKNYLRKLPFIVKKITISDDDVKREQAIIAQEQLKKANLKKQQDERDKAIAVYVRTMLGKEIKPVLDKAITSAYWTGNSFSEQELTKRLELLKKDIGDICPIIGVDARVLSKFDQSKQWNLEWQVDFWQGFTDPGMDGIMGKNLPIIFLELRNTESKRTLKFLYFVGHNYFMAMRGKSREKMTASALPPVDSVDTEARNIICKLGSARDASDIEPHLNRLKILALNFFGKEMEYSLDEANFLIEEFCGKLGSDGVYKEKYIEAFNKYEKYKEQIDAKSEEESLESELPKLNQLIRDARAIKTFSNGLRAILSKISKLCIGKEIPTEDSIYSICLELGKFMNNHPNHEYAKKYAKDFKEIWSVYCEIYLEKLKSNILYATIKEGDPAHLSGYISVAKSALISVAKYCGVLRWDICNVTDEEVPRLCDYSRQKFEQMETKGASKIVKEKFEKLCDSWKGLKKALEEKRTTMKPEDLEWEEVD